MARNRTKGQRELDLVKTAKLFLEGRPQTYIAGEIGVSQPTIKRDIDELLKRWRDDANSCFDQAKAQALASVNHLEATYWEAWHASKKEKTKTTTEQTLSPVQKMGDTAANGRKKVQVMKEMRDGNPRFLEGIADCINKRMKILGVEAPKKIAPTMPDGETPYQGGAVFLIPDDGSPMPDLSGK